MFLHFFLPMFCSFPLVHFQDSSHSISSCNLARRLLKLFSKGRPLCDTMHSYDHHGGFSYSIYIMGSGRIDFHYYSEYFEARQKIYTALVKQSPQKQLLLSFICFYRVYFGFIQRDTYIYCRTWLCIYFHRWHKFPYSILLLVTR